MSLRPGTLARHLQLDEQFSGSLESEPSGQATNGGNEYNYDDEDFEHSSEVERSNSEIVEEIADGEENGTKEAEQEKSDKQKSKVTKKHVSIPQMKKSASGWFQTFIVLAIVNLALTF